MSKKQLKIHFYGKNVFTPFQTNFPQNGPVLTLSRGNKILQILPKYLIWHTVLKKMITPLTIVVIGAIIIAFMTITLISIKMIDYIFMLIGMLELFLFSHLFPRNISGLREINNNLILHSLST